MIVTIRDTAYEVDADLMRALEAAYDVYRDGLGKFSGPLGKAAFMRGTSDIVMRAISPDPSDPYKQTRYLKCFRHVLASRPRATV